MRSTYLVALAIMAGTVSACSDDSSSGTPPTLEVTLAPSATSQTAPERDTATGFTLSATYTGATSEPVVPDLSYDKALLALDGAIAQDGKTITAKFKTLAGLAAKDYSSTVGLRLCKEAGCTTVYPGSTKSFTYSLSVALNDWTTLQRNAAHDGYVHATFDPAAFTKAWEWAPAGSSRFTEIAARKGSIFVTRTGGNNSFQPETTIHALDSSNGTERWVFNAGNIYSASGPALSGDYLAISTMISSSGENQIKVLNPDTGQFRTNLIFGAQWSRFAQPTPAGNELYIASGYYGNVVYSYDLSIGGDRWKANGNRGNTWDGETPAVDDRYVYYYSGSLDVFDRATGSRVKSIVDPNWTWNGYSYLGGPMLGSNNHVIAYSGNGMGTYSVSFPLVDYDIAAGAVRWRSTRSYSILPAVAAGVVYAASNSQGQLDAISEATGAPQWSWMLPNGETFVGNIIVTDTLVFVSTTAKVYAIALDGTHEVKWSAPTPGSLAITPDAKLIVSPVTIGNGGKLTSYSLR